MNFPDNQVEAGRMLLDPALNMAAARPLAQQLLATRGAGLIVDASQVEQLGAQCLQVLASAVLTWQADDQNFAVVDPSPAFLEGVRLLGLDSFFKLREWH